MALRAYEGREPYIFISYAHKDMAKVLPIIEGLAEKGFRIWYDAGIEAGTEWPEYIAEHLENCAAFVAFISEAAIASKNCRREINFAIDLDKEPLAIYLEEVKLTAGMRMQLGTLQAMFYYRHPSLTSFVDSLAEAKSLQGCSATGILNTASASGKNADIFNQFLTQSNAKTGAGAFSALSGTTKPANTVTAPTSGELPVIHGKNEVTAEVAKWSEEGIEFYDDGDYPKAFPLLLKAAEGGDMDAQFYLGCCYDFGRGTAVDHYAAFRWYKAAAEQGDEYAQNNLGYCYYNGEGVAKDLVEAAKWYRASANQGHTSAEYSIGRCYVNGEGVPQDYAEGAKWYRRAAEKGDEDAQFGLGNRYQYGEGVAKDVYEAFKWCALTTSARVRPTTPPKRLNGIKRRQSRVTAVRSSISASAIRTATV